MRWIAILLFLALTACDAPGPGFRDVPATRVTLQGATFEIRVKGSQAQAIRINRQYAPRLGSLGALSAMAMEQVSGCDVIRIKGDAALIIGLLRCEDDARDPAGYALRHSGVLECYSADDYVSPATDEIVAHYDCDWRID